MVKFIVAAKLTVIGLFCFYMGAPAGLISHIERSPRSGAEAAGKKNKKLATNGTNEHE
jgi:hypothetical protein